ncbi:unnamed protein product [Brassica oleracea var. botrytis]|uniref:(rape) hypothetical protein n=1 Tax=Brassica napus TaxID=3708 RepID=A0A816U8V4_BRANA|nr:unnamed protein product [Brassica napus]
MDLCGGHPQKLLSSPKFKTLYLVRHAQGIHNVVLEEKRGIDEIGDVHLSPKLFDAPLSPKGVQQVSEQHKQILESGLLNTIELVITSPLRRAMETAVGIFRGHKDINLSHNFPPIVALELCRERMGLYPCDRRESISTRRICFPEIDFTMVESDEDALWREEERENLEEVSARGFRFLKWLWERPEKEIAVVSHGIFLQQTLCALHEKVSIPLEDSLLTRLIIRFLKLINHDRDIPAPNIDLHRVHCARNLEKCKICGDMVPKKHAEEHFANTHAPVPCSMCKETIAREAFDNHKGELCPKRIVTCEFCEFPLPAVDLAEHQEVCGNRTELCYQCNSYVRLRETYSHQTKCPGSVLNNVESSRRIPRAAEGDGNGRRRRDGNGVSNKRLFFTIAITGIAVLIGSLFFQRKPEGS